MAYYCFAVAVFKSAVSQVELQAIEGGFPERRLAPIVLPIIEKEPANKVLQLPVKQNQIQDCPRISVTCPDASRGGNTPIRFKASVIGGKPSSEVSYNWSVIPVMTLNRRTGSGSDLAGSQHSIANHQLYRPNHRRGRKAPWNVTLKLSDANRPGRYRFLFCG